MKRNSWLLPVLLLTFLPILSRGQGQINPKITQKYTVSQLQTDLIILKEALVKAHPGLFWYQTEKQFEDRFKHVYSSIDRPLTEIDFYKLIRPFVSDVKCVHTSVRFSNTTLNYFIDSVKYVPISIELINHKVYIQKEYSGNTDVLPGMELSAINGRGMQSTLQDMNAYSFKDGENVEAAEYRQKWMFPFLFMLLYGETEVYQLDLVESSGKKQKVELKGMTDKAMYELRMAGMTKNAFRYSIVDSLKTAILTIDQFVGKGFPKFLKNFFNTVERNTIENLIIDVRQNGGGEDEFASLLYAYIAREKFNYYDHLEITVDNPDDTIFKYGKLEPYIAKAFKRHQLLEKNNGLYDFKSSLHPNLKNAPFEPKKNGFKKTVYILIGETSFSATTEFCAITHAHKRATFIGRETGGCYCGNTSGGDFELTLPNSGFVVNIPLVRYYMAVENCPYGRGIQPDHRMEKSILNLANNKDAEMHFTLNLIRTSNLK